MFSTRRDVSRSSACAGIIAPLLDELLVIRQRGGEQSLADRLHSGPVGQLFLADLDQLIHRPAGEPEPRLGLDGALPLVLVGAFRPLLRVPRLALLATDERRADR